MSKWIRGRLGRPIASIISGLMLVSLLLPMATPPVQAQIINPNALADFFGKEIVKPTPIIVLDFVNRSKFQTGMLGRTLTDALSIELTNTRTFEVVKRSEVERVMSEFNLSLPLTVSAQAMLADRLNSQYLLSGDIDNIDILKSREGMFAEVSISAIVISRITQLPINGAQVIVRSSPKIGYSGNKDVLVNEALSIAAYQITQKIMDNRLPISVVLNTPKAGQVVLRGGSTLGFHKGMVLTTVRRGQVTGRVRITLVNPAESYGEVLEDSKGIAPGDKGVPIFEYAYSPHAEKEVREKAGIQIASVLSLGFLLTLVGTNNHNNRLDHNVSAPSAMSMADAVAMGELDGANLVRWPSYGQRIIAYVIYRDTNAMIPIAVVDGHTNYYIDSSKPLAGPVGSMAQQDTITITLDPDKGIVQDFTDDITFLTDPSTATNTMTVTDASADITTLRVPLSPGQRCGYRLRVIYMDYMQPGLSDTGTSTQAQYSLFLGNLSPSSNRVTDLLPPQLVSPTNNNLPTDGIFKSTQSPAALSYILQISVNDPTFEQNSLLPLNGITPHPDGTAYVMASYSLTDLYTDLNTWQQYHTPLSTTEGTPIYWRIGARVAGDPNPTALADPNQNGWVFSRGDIGGSSNYFLLPPSPPPLPNVRHAAGGAGLPGKLPGVSHDPSQSRMPGSGRHDRLLTR